MAIDAMWREFVPLDFWNRVRMELDEIKACIYAGRMGIERSACQCF